MRIAVYNSVPVIYQDGEEVSLHTDQKGVLSTANSEAIPLGATYETFTTGASDITDTSSHAVFAAKGAGTHHYITSVLVTNAGTVDTVVYIEDGSTIVFAGFAKAGNGFVWNPSPYFYQAGANAAINVVCRTNGAAIQVNAIAYWI